MAETDEAEWRALLGQVVEAVGLYPVEAYEFVFRGLTYTVDKVHGPAPRAGPALDRHVTGQQLSEGLRDFALLQWGLLARTVLRRWNVTRTLDFGRIVFALVEHGLMQRTEHDSVEDFRDVYDFATAFETGYKIAPHP